MSRKTIFIAALAAAITFPAAASASCGTLQGSYAVTCEQGVQVYRHQALSSIPRGLSQAQAQLEAEKIRAKTAQRSIAALALALALFSQSVCSSRVAAIVKFDAKSSRSSSKLF